ncbi:pseudouridine synthase [Oceanomicrobium pacificus]|uniref:Dual-specificity RNA pseudouridine synthase RluA n=1 Tax=Oceanomicrobium pacificus TaxID=2692916 RepID=A0A6B0TNK9_9RHOB|nr:pseudouridine synthase [Oceanomicrobium pacificus]MXU64169.1 RNA pseudouridine synthase [Oceanomicrobium pacificus]
MTPFTYRPPDGPLRVIHSDAALLILDKPPGLLSVPGKGPDLADCLLSRAVAMDPAALLVHRLDLDTSGVMVFARTPAAQRHLGLQFERRHVSKTYIAEIWGHPERDSGEIDLPLICDWPNRPKQMVDFERGKAARTGWEVLERGADRTRVRLSPQTGRSHQLRVHMQAMGHPILGDRFYADGAALAASDRLRLHAARLDLYHPDGGTRVAFEAPCPF